MKSMKNAGLHLILIFYLSFNPSRAMAPLNQSQFRIWNVGQGQWITRITGQSCSHFDFGGEIQYFNQIQNELHDLCYFKTNQLFLSHADLDHFSFLPLLIHRLPKICWAQKPSDPRLRRFESIPNCAGSDSFQKQNKVRRTKQTSQTFLIPCEPKKRNECSTIFRRGRYLLPGDSPIKSEKLWSPYLESMNEIEILVLGHHGSATSTGAQLLESLPSLKTAIASSRKAVYNHPNKKVRERLGRRGLQILTTESWGNIVFLE